MFYLYFLSILLLFDCQQSSSATETGSNVDCQDWRIIDQAVSCEELARRISIPIDEFHALNPTLDCGKQWSPTIRAFVCFRGNSTVNCAEMVEQKRYLTCDYHAKFNNITLEELMRLNPTLDCENMKHRKEVCVGSGPFKYSECVTSVKVGKTQFDDCPKLFTQTRLTKAQLIHMNPELNCSKKFDSQSLICVNSFGMDVKKAKNILMKSISEVDSTFEETYEAFLKSPNGKYEENRNQIYKSFLKPKVNSRMKMLYKQDSDIRTIIDGHYPLPRHDYCTGYGNNKALSDEIKSCFCDNVELLTYCQALAQQAISKSVGEKYTNITRVPQKTKRGLVPYCEPSAEVFKGCVGLGCGAILGIIKFGIHGELCVPLSNRLRDSIFTCNFNLECYWKKANDDAGLMKAMDLSITFKGQACFLYEKISEPLNKLWEEYQTTQEVVDIIDKANTILPGEFQLPKAFLPPLPPSCETAFSVEFYPLKGLAKLLVGVKTDWIELTYNCNIKIFEPFMRFLCERPAFAKELHCQWLHIKHIRDCWLLAKIIGLGTERIPTNDAEQRFDNIFEFFKHVL